jgi:hypothetical protein
LIALSKGAQVESSREVGRALVEVEISEWFDWARRELVAGGLDLPSEEALVAFTGHALRLRDRIKVLYRHVPLSLEKRLIQSAIVYQSWGLNRKMSAQAKWPGANRAQSLIAVDAIGYISPVGPEWGCHLIRGRDGFQYIVTVPSGFPCEKVLASQVICNSLARSFGLAVPRVAIISIDAGLRKDAHDSRPGRAHQTRRGTELCAGFRYGDSTPSYAPTQDKRRMTPRNIRQQLGSLVFDIWTMSLLPRQWLSGFNEATGKVDSILVDNNGGLAGGDWIRFLASEIKSLVAPQASAANVRRWEQLDPWISRAIGLDLNPLWEIAFQMPPEWYGCDRQILASVLGKLATRGWELSRAAHHFVEMGYFPGLKMPPSRVGAKAGDEARPLAKPA